MSNMFENMKIQDIVLVIVVIIIIYLLFRNNSSNENFKSNDTITTLVKNLSTISTKIIDSNSNLTITYNTNMDGNLIVKGDITSKGNNNKPVILGCVFGDGYYGPILDSNGFSIPVTKYWCKQPIFYGSLSYDIVVGGPSSHDFFNESFAHIRPLPYLIENKETNEWWAYYTGSGNRDVVFLFEFIPRDTLYSGTYLPAQVTPFSDYNKPAGYKNIMEWGIGVITVSGGNDSGSAMANTKWPIQNTTSPNPFKN